MESQPENPELRNNPENFHPCILYSSAIKTYFSQSVDNTLDNEK